MENDEGNNTSFRGSKLTRYPTPEDSLVNHVDIVTHTIGLLPFSGRKFFLGNWQFENGTDMFFITINKNNRCYQKS